MALGYSLVYGVLRFVNFAHGEIVALSAFITLFLSNGLGMDSIWSACLLGGIAGALAAVILERLVYRPLRGFGSLTLLLASFGASMVIQASMGILWGARSRVLKIRDPEIEIAGIVISLRHILLIFLAIMTAACLEFGLRRSVWGLVVRGYSRNPLQIAALGIPVDRSVFITFAITGFLAGVAGVCLGLQSGVDPQMGTRVGLWAFAATVVGGLGSIRGTLLGGFLLGIVLTLAARFLSVLYTDGIAFLAMVAVLFIRPKGIFAFLDRGV